MMNIKYRQHAKESLYLLGKSKNKLPILILLFLFSSILDLAGIGLIAPYIGLIVNSKDFMQNDIIQFLIAIGLPSQSNDLILTLGVLLILVFFFKTVISIYVNRSILNFCFNIGVNVRSNLMNAYQNMQYSEYIQRNSSEYIYNIQQLSTQYSQLYLQSFLRLVSEGLVGFVILLLLAWTNIYALALLVTLLGGMVFFYDHIFRLKIQRYGEDSNLHSTKMLQAVNEGVEGLKELRILGKEGYFYNILVGEAKGYANVNIEAGMISAMPRYFLEFILISFVVLLVFSSILLEFDLELLLPVLSMFGVAAMRLAPSANQIINGMTKIRYSYHSVSTLYNDLKGVKLNNNGAINNKKIIAFKALSFENVVYSYPKTIKPAISNLSIDINSGESIGLIGVSGSGKTTMVDLLLGLLTPDSGEIKFNKDPLVKNLLNWRSQVAYIPQNIFLLDDTLQRNIAIESNKDIDGVKLKKAINQAQLAELVGQLPNGVDTILGERGIRLSGGQRQRIALARAFYHDRSILIMDEATSALDNETEKEIVKEIKSLKGKKTLIVIAHRLSTIEHCDCVYKLKDGRIIEKGTYQEVVNHHNRTL
jgi:ATP-binding cassette, subfamily B, bacterial PglK